MKKLLLSLLLIAPIHAGDTEQSRQEVLDEVTAQLELMDAKNDEPGLGYLAAGATALGAGGIAIAAIARRDIVALRTAVETISSQVSARHNWAYPSWLPTAAGWGVLSLMVGGVVFTYRQHRHNAQLSDKLTDLDTDISGLNTAVRGIISRSNKHLKNTKNMQITLDEIIDSDTERE